MKITFEYILMSNSMLLPDYCYYFIFHDLFNFLFGIIVAF